MPKRKCCEHPIKHANSTRVPKGIMAVSLQLSKFLVSRYNMTETQTRWLCPRCHAFKSKEMTAYQAVHMSDNDVSSDDDDAMMVEVLDNCGTNDDDHATEELSEEEEDNAQMDSGFMNESKENDHDSLDMDEKSTDCESMDEEEGAVSYEHEYRKNKVMEQLSAVFELLKIEPIHDK
jgi:hypothetical protein